MQEGLVNHLGGRSLPRKSVVRLTDRPDMTLDVYRGRKTTTQQLCFPSPKYIVLHFFDYKMFFSFGNIPKNKDPSNKTGLDLWDCLGRVKLVL